MSRNSDDGILRKLRGSQFEWEAADIAEVVTGDEIREKGDKSHRCNI